MACANQASGGSVVLWFRAKGAAGWVPRGSFASNAEALRALPTEAGTVRLLASGADPNAGRFGDDDGADETAGEWWEGKAPAGR